MKVNLIVILFVLSGILQAQIPQVSTGRIQRLQHFQSDYVSARNIDVWLPEGYNPARKYPVLYMHDGQMLFDSQVTWNSQEWGMDEIAGRLIAEGKLEPFIVVGIWNSGPGRHSEYFPQKPFEALSPYDLEYIRRESAASGRNFFSRPINSDNYLKFIVKELKPYIDKHFSTRRNRANTYIAGASMGGLISLYALCEYPKVFGAAACISTHWPGISNIANNPVPQAFINYFNEKLPPPARHRLYFDYGTEGIDAWYETHQLRIDSLLITKKYDPKHWETQRFDGHDHSENAWRSRLDVILMFLMGNEK